MNGKRALWLLISLQPAHRGSTGVGVDRRWSHPSCRELSPDSDPTLQALRSDDFVDLMAARYAYDLHRHSTIVLLALSSGRLLFLSDFGSHSRLTTTLRRSLPNIISFSTMFIILMLSFSMLANLVFGTDLYDFHTFFRSLFVLVEVIIGQLDYMSLTTTNRFLGPLFYMAFIFFVVFVLYNMFIVILNDTYFMVQEEAAATKDSPMYEVSRWRSAGATTPPAPLSSALRYFASPRPLDAAFNCLE